jgi:acylphosphatase
MTDEVTLAVRVVGAVQGVGYRAFIRKRAPRPSRICGSS